MPTIALLIALCAGALVVALLAFLLGRSIGVAKGSAIADLELHGLREQLTEAAKRLAVSENQNQTFQEAQQSLTTTFKVLAGEALTTSSSQLLATAEERFKRLQESSTAELDKRKVAIENLVTPLDQSLKEFDKKLKDLEEKRLRDHSDVSSGIAALGNASSELKTQTINLVQSLRSSDVRGKWGQMQLRRTVEIAGMLKHCDFFEQVSEDTETGRLRPDLIVQLPGGRKIIVDAKAPLMYLEGVSHSEEEKAKYLKEYASRVRRHMNQLANKKYWEEFTPTLEFVVMFLPVEAHFAAALNEDPELLEFGAEKKVIPASPLTLIALLQAVNYGWKQESIAQDAAQVRDLGRALYEAVRVLAGHMESMRDNLEQTVKAFNASVGSVERNFLTKARRLVDLNAAGSEEIPQLEAIHEGLRRIEASELRADVEAPTVDGALVESSDAEPQSVP